MRYANSTLRAAMQYTGGATSEAVVLEAPSGYGEHPPPPNLSFYYYLNLDAYTVHVEERDAQAKTFE